MQVLEIRNGGRDGLRGARLACLEGDPLASRFHAWHGRSGKRYLASIFAIDHAHPGADLPDLGPGVLIAVSRSSGRRAVGLQAIERSSDWSRAVEALHHGADEWHVHLLAADRAARAAAVADLGMSGLRGPAASILCLDIEPSKPLCGARD